MDSIANGYGCRPCKIKQVQLDVTDAIIHFIGDGSALSNLNASNVAFGTLSTSVFPASGVTAGTYGSSSNISQITIDQYGRVTSAANVTSVSSQWTGLPGSSIYYIPGVSVGSSADATANLQVTGNVYVSNSVTTTNVFATAYYGDGGLLSNVASQWSGTKGSPIYYIPGVSVGSSADATANLQVTGNVYVSNAVTVPNVHVTDTIDVTGALTANAANATFFFDTFTIPYINTQYLNVSSNTTLTGNLVVATANIATLNVGYLTVNSAVVYGATTLNVYGTSNLTNVYMTSANVETLNVWQISNLSTLTLTNNLYTSNALSTTNIFATGNIVVGPSPTAIQSNLHVERGDVFIGNSAITNTNFTTTGPVNRLIFDNSANTSVVPNKIVLISNIVGNYECGLGVSGVSSTGAFITYDGRTGHVWYTGATTNRVEQLRLTSGGSLGFGTNNPLAKLHISGSTTTSVRIDSSNIALVTSGSGLVGFGTITPTANLHVIGNVYASNALQTTNVFANTTTLAGTTGQTTLNVTGNLYVSNTVTTTNITCAGFTSNVSNTIFNFDTLTIPFINSTTLNVASTSNLQIVTLTGTTGQTTLNVTGNIYTSNALTTTNVFATAGASIGPVVLGTNVFVFSNVSGGSNVLIMNNLGRVGITNVSPGYPLDVGTTVSIPASGSETIRSKGPVIIGNGSNDGNRFISALDSSVTTGDSRYIAFGKAGSIYNQVELSYTHDTDGSTNNKFNIGFFSKNVMTLLASGNIGIGTITPSATVHTIGNTYVSNAVTTTNVFASTVSTTNPISFRNRVINGDFFIDQRNSGASSTPGAGAVVSIDRWKVNLFGSGRCLVGQNLGSFAQVPGFASYYGMKVTTTTAVGASDYFFFSQVIEGINTVDWGWGAVGAKPVTLSFWVQSSLTGTAGGFVRNAGATAGNYTRSYPFTFTINNTLTWEYKTITIPGDTTGQWFVGNGQTDGAEFCIALWNGSTYQSAAGAWGAGNFTGPTGGTINYAGTLNSYMNLTGVQVELGPVATLWERRLYNFELAACQRYYETEIARVGGYNTNGAYLRGSVYFNTKKRPAASPSFTVVSILETSNVGTLNFDNSNFDGSSARYLVPLTSTGDAYGQWKVSVDCEF